ncbi:hypothetical protein BK010_09255 [Tenericutes bacterium MO-XQ]|nr:hypothetical protein BK010_09255 [Tenericutes bacterium MO-XQ]
MAKFEFETSMQFPVTFFKTEIEHNDVKKPSGISYILLVLINDYRMKKQKLSTLLLEFGIPRDLHFIFADEIEKLIHDLGILEIPFEYNRNFFDDYEVGHFNFTSKGRKIFKDELIPSNKSIIDVQDLYYDPARDKIYINNQINWKFTKVKSSVIPDELAKRYEFKNLERLEDFLNKNKGNGIVVKKEEYITKINILLQNDYSFLITTFSANIVIDSNKDTVRFIFEDPKLQDFFNKIYNAKLKSEMLTIKRKFRFSAEVPNLETIKNLKVVNIKLPEELANILNTKADFVVCKTGYEPKQKNNVMIDNVIVDQVNSDLKFIYLYKNKTVGYIPANLDLLNEDTDEIIRIPFILEIAIDSEDKSNIVTSVIDSCEDYSLENIKTIYDAGVLNDNYVLIEEAYEKYFSPDIEENISLMRNIKNLIDVKKIESWYNRKLKSLYDNYFNNLAFDNLELLFSRGEWMIQELAISEGSIIQKIIESNPDVEQLKLFEYFEDKKYSYKSIFSNMSIYDKFINYIVSGYNIPHEGKFVQKIKNLQKSLKEINAITGTSFDKAFLIDEDIDKQAFKKLYLGFKMQFKEIEKYKSFAEEKHAALYTYLENLDYLLDILDKEEFAQNNVTNMTEKSILSQIDKKNYLSVVISLSIKLEANLKNKIGLRGKLIDMINNVDHEILNPEEKNSLHKLRKLRNDLIHANRDNITYKPDDLKEYTRIIFKKEMNDL